MIYKLLLIFKQYDNETRLNMTTSQKYHMENNTSLLI